jgi:hypothetical protein
MESLLDYTAICINNYLILGAAMIEQKDKDSIYEMVSYLVKISNNAELSDELVKRLTQYEHRTNQQLIFSKIIIPIMKKYADKQNGQYDLRNYDTITFCKNISDKLDDSHFDYI